MPTSIYTDPADDTSNISEWSNNNICIALALNGKKLTKIVYPKGEKAYDNAYHYKFFNRDVGGLDDLLSYVKVLLNKPDCCLIRGVCKDDSISSQRRLLYDDKSKGAIATIIEQPQNWYALDVDGYGQATGILEQDAKQVLLALGLVGVEAFAIPSAGYLRKPGIRIRLFLWNSMKVTCLSLKKHFEQYKKVVDLALFRPIQPIYISRPIFSGCSDPCNKLISWLPGERAYTDIEELYNTGINKSEELYTRKQARHFFDSFLRDVFDVKENSRHTWLYNKSIACGKWIWQEILDEEDVIEELYLATAVWGGNRKKDMQTILDGIKMGKQAMEGNNEL